MTLSLFDYVVLGVLAIILLPVLLTPAGWLFAGLLAALWLLLTYGGRYLLELNKWKSEGERGRVSAVRQRARDRGDRD